MIIKKAVYKKVKVIQNKMVTDDIYGCDCCKAVIADYPNETQRLEVGVFKKSEAVTGTLHFCSWKCVLEAIPKIKSDYFVTLPYMYFDEGKGKRTATELIKLLQAVSKK